MLSVSGFEFWFMGGGERLDLALDGRICQHKYVERATISTIL